MVDVASEAPEAPLPPSDESEAPPQPTTTMAEGAKAAAAKTRVLMGMGSPAGIRVCPPAWWAWRIATNPLGMKGYAPAVRSERVRPRSLLLHHPRRSPL